MFKGLLFPGRCIYACIIVLNYFVDLWQIVTGYITKKLFPDVCYIMPIDQFTNVSVSKYITGVVKDFHHNSRSRRLIGDPSPGIQCVTQVRYSNRKQRNVGIFGADFTISTRSPATSVHMQH